MKRTVVLLVLVLALSVLFAGVAVAGESEGIKDLDEARDSVSEEAPGEKNENQEAQEDYVGKDMELEEGEMGITAVEGDAEVRDEPASSDEDYVGKYMELEEGEVGIISIDEGESSPGEKEGVNYLLYGGILGLSGISFVAFKKVRSK